MCTKLLLQIRDLHLSEVEDGSGQTGTDSRDGLEQCDKIICTACTAGSDHRDIYALADSVQ